MGTGPVIVLVVPHQYIPMFVFGHMAVALESTTPFRIPTMEVGVVLHTFRLLTGHPVPLVGVLKPPERQDGDLFLLERVHREEKGREPRSRLGKINSKRSHFTT
jgi:hypothetical protein